MTTYDKLYITLRYWLLGMSQTDKNYLKCIEALEYASKFHSGTRKDGITPEFQHQLTITHYIRTLLNSLNNPCETLTVGILHDCPEDYNVGFDEIENRFGSIVSKSTFIMTKLHRGYKKTKEDYFHSIAQDPIASIVKGADRIHNLQSMSGVFSKEKQIEYIQEAEEWILPSLKEARRKFPSQELAYENIKLLMMSQISLLKLIN